MEEPSLSNELSIESINNYCSKLKSNLSDCSKLLSSIASDDSTPEGFRLLLKEKIKEIKDLIAG